MIIISLLIDSIKVMILGNHLSLFMNCIIIILYFRISMFDKIYEFYEEWGPALVVGYIQGPVEDTVGIMVKKFERLDIFRDKDKCINQNINVLVNHFTFNRYFKVLDTVSFFKNYFSDFNEVMYIYNFKSICIFIYVCVYILD